MYRVEDFGHVLRCISFIHELHPLGALAFIYCSYFLSQKNVSADISFPNHLCCSALLLRISWYMVRCLMQHSYQLLFFMSGYFAAVTFCF